MPVKPNPASDDYALGRIEAKVDMLLAGRLEDKARMDELEDRTSKLERGRSWLLGAGAALSLMGSGLGALLVR